MILGNGISQDMSKCKKTRSLYTAALFELTETDKALSPTANDKPGSLIDFNKLLVFDIYPEDDVACGTETAGLFSCVASLIHELDFTSLLVYDKYADDAFYQ